jgi:Survival protein SurE
MHRLLLLGYARRQEPFSRPSGAGAVRGTGAPRRGHAAPVVYSGTIGADLEAAILGTPAICLSQQTPTGSFSVNYREDLASTGLAYDFSFAAAHGAHLARSVIQVHPAGPTRLPFSLVPVLHRAPRGRMVMLA